MVGPLRANRDFQLLWAGQAVSVLGSRVSAIAYPLLVLALTGSPALTGLVGFVGSLPYIVFQLPAGAVADRLDRRRLMIGCDVGRAAALASIPTALALGRLTVGLVAAAAFVEGTLFVFFRLGEVAAIRAVVRPDQYTQALSQNEGRVRAATLLGQPIGGFLFALGAGAPFLADACSYLASLGTLLLIRSPFQEERAGGARHHVIAEVREGIAWLGQERFVLVTVLAAATTNLLFQALVLVIIVLERRRGAPPGLIGLILAGFGAGGVLGSLSATWLQRRLRPTAIVIGAVWVWALLTPLVAVVAQAALLTAVLAGLAFLGACWNVAVNTYYLAVVPDRLVGRVSSVGSLAAFGALPLGSLAGGLLLQAAGPLASAAAIAAAMLGVAVLTTLSRSVRQGVRRLDSAPKPEA